MTPERALEIIAAYGADSARWPDEARRALPALAARDAEVAAALVAAADLDGLLGGWAQAVAPGDFDLAAIAALPQERPAATRNGPWPRRWIGGGALAAAVAAGLVILAPMPTTSDPAVATLSPTTSVPSATADGNAGGSDAEAFASVFTPTPDEEELI